MPGFPAARRRTRTASPATATNRSRRSGAGKTVSLYRRTRRNLRGSIHASQLLRRLPRRPGGEGAAARGDALRASSAGPATVRSAEQHAASLHGRRSPATDPLAPGARTCHGTHEILAAKNHRSASRSPAHPVSLRQVPPGRRPRSRGSGRSTSRTSSRTTRRASTAKPCCSKGLIVSATCASCHTAHTILPHTDPRSSHRPEEHRRDLHAVPRADRAGAPQGDPRRAVGEGSARSPGVRRLPPAAQGAQGVLRPGDGRQRLPALPRTARTSGHRRTAVPSASQARDLSAFQAREDGLQPVPLGGERLAHAPVRDDHAEGRLRLVPRRGGAAVSEQHARDACWRRTIPTPPTARSATARTGCLGQEGSRSRATFPTNVPDLCARCHREGQKAAVRYTGTEHEIIERYTESIHGKGLLKSGLTVTAMCTDCHTAHGVLPHADPAIERQPEERARAPAAGATTASRSSSSRAFTRPRHGKTDKQTAGLQRLPHRAHDPPRGRRGLQAGHHEQVRPLPRGDREDVFRHVSRQGVPARLHEDGEVLRLPRRARHPAGVRSRGRT